jgi:hypothetical protein
VSGEFVDKRVQSKLVINPCPWEKVSVKLYVEIVYICDFLILKMHSEFLRCDGFKIPILISIYILLSITVGDVHLNQNYIWPKFERFLGVYRLVPEEDIAKIKADTQRYFN